MIIYIDVIFLENLILNFIILYVTGLISKSKIKLWKIIVRCSNWSFLCNNILLYKFTKNGMEFNTKIYFINCNDICIFQAKKYKRNSQNAHIFLPNIIHIWWSSIRSNIYGKYWKNINKKWCD